MGNTNNDEWVFCDLPINDRRRLDSRAEALWGFDNPDDPAERSDKVAALRAAEYFAEGGDPMDAVRSLTLAGSWGCPPPPEVLQWVVNGFGHYEATGESLDKALGLTRRDGRGQSSPWKQHRGIFTIRLLMDEMEMIRAALAALDNVSITETAEMVASRLENDPNAYIEDFMPVACRQFTAMTLEKYWNNHSARTGTRRVLKISADFDLQAFLRCYPEDGLPRRILKKISVPGTR